MINVIGDIAGRLTYCSTTLSIPAAHYATPQTPCSREARRAYRPTSRTAFYRAARSPASPRRSSANSCSPIIQPTEAVRVARNIRVISIAPLIGEAIGRIAKRKASRRSS